MWMRFIDDILLIWQHGQEQLDKFENHLNNCLDSIKFETESSKNEVHFLDVTVQLTQNTIQTSLNTKPTDAHNYCKTHYYRAPFNFTHLVLGDDTAYITCADIRSK